MALKQAKEELLKLAVDIIQEDESLLFTYLASRKERDMCNDLYVIHSQLLCRHLIAIGNVQTRGLSMMKALLDLPGDKFKSQLGIANKTFGYLVVLLKTNQGGMYKDRELSDIQFDLVLTLWYLTHTESPDIICTRFGLTLDIFTQKTNSIIQELCSLKGDYMKWPTLAQQRECSKHPFGIQSGLPRVIGLLHVLHLPIKGFNSILKDQFTNKKGKKVAACQIVIGHDGTIYDAYVYSAGMRYNSQVLVESKLVERCTSVLTGLFCIIGDSSYPSKKGLLTPFIIHREAADKQSFNTVLEGAIQKLESKVGSMLNRFKRLKALKCKFAKFGEHVWACFVLNNICVENKDLYSEGSDVKRYCGSVNGRLYTDMDDEGVEQKKLKIAQNILKHT